MAGQAGFFDATERLRLLSASGNPSANLERRGDCARTHSSPQLPAGSTHALPDCARAEAVAQRLDRSGANLRLDVEVALAEAAAADLAAAHQLVPEGRPLLEIVDRGGPDVEIIAPSNWLNWIHPGHLFVLRIDKTGRDYVAQVERLSARVDPVRQTFKIHGRLNDSHLDLLPGMSGTMQIARPVAL